MKHMVIAMRVNQNPSISGKDLSGQEVTIPFELPDGAVGLCFVFESKKSARDYYGKDVDLCRLQWSEKKGA